MIGDFAEAAASKSTFCAPGMGGLGKLPKLSVENKQLSAQFGQIAQKPLPRRPQNQGAVSIVTGRAHFRRRLRQLLQESSMSSMHARMAILGIIALFASAAFGQTASGSGVDRTFQLVGGESPREIQEIVNCVRSTTEMREIVQDAAHGSIAVQGTADQIALAAWTIAELDQPTKAANLTYITYLLPGGRDPVVRIFYLTHARTPQEVQEIINIVRSATEVQRITAYSRSSAVVLRGSQTQAALAEWLVKGLDVAPGQQLASAQYPGPDPYPGPNPLGFVTSIFYLTHGETPQQTQEMVNVLRSLGEIQRVTACNAIRAITIRVGAAQTALAAWLVSELDKPAPQAPAIDSYLMQGTADSAVRVFYLPGISTPQGLQEIATLVQKTASVPRTTPYSGVNAVAVRGTAGQIALAEQVVEQRAKL
jgi:type II secretory pathway component GspD/PulD (secretin)